MWYFLWTFPTKNTFSIELPPSSFEDMIPKIYFERIWIVIFISYGTDFGFTFLFRSKKRFFQKILWKWPLQRTVRILYVIPFVDFSNKKIFNIELPSSSFIYWVNTSRRLSVIQFLHIKPSFGSPIAFPKSMRSRFCIRYQTKHSGAVWLKRWLALKVMIQRFTL